MSLPIKINLLPDYCTLKSRLLAGDIPNSWHLVSFPMFKPFIAAVALIFLLGRICWYVLLGLIFVLPYLLRGIFWLAISPVLIPIRIYRFFTSDSTDFAIVVDCAPQEIPALAQTLQDQAPEVPWLTQIPGPISFPPVWPFTQGNSSALIYSAYREEPPELPRTGVVTVTKRRTSRWFMRRLSEIRIPTHRYPVPSIWEERSGPTPLDFRDSIPGTHLPRLRVPHARR